VPAGICTTHTQNAARFECDGCHKLLCDDCVEESHRLLLCRHCGERALPLDADAPATTQERRQRALPAGAEKYGIGAALLYPFRGSGLMLFIAAVLSGGFVSFVRRFGFGCFPYILWVGWLSLLVGIQFKIVISTVRWENELPDWPEYFSFGERIVELLTWVVIALLNYGPVVAYVVAFGREGLLTDRPQAGFWIGAAAALWLGTALSVMALGSAAVHWRRSALRIDQHLRGLFAAGGDAVKTVNVSFVLLGVFLVVRAALGAQVPMIGTTLAGIVGLYWMFLAPHLVGLLFRTRRNELHQIYEG
jgi:hypothetical protein